MKTLNQKSDKVNTLKEIAKIADVSHDTIRMADKYTNIDSIKKVEKILHL